jgi:signal transduction histidine kinase/DNA-binding LacI/PurR family transcriptional regulator/DNA-binding response OmpR family regulator
MNSSEGKRRATIGVLLGAQAYYGTILGNYIGPVFRGVCSAAQDYGCNLLLSCGMAHYNVLARPGWPVPSPDVDFVPVGPWNTDGLIVINPLLSEVRSRYIQELIEAGTLVTFISSGESGPMVTVDNEGGIRQAIAHLVNHGHRSVAFIAGYPQDATGDSEARLNAYQAAVEAYDLVVDSGLIVYGRHSIDGGMRAMQQLLNSQVSFTAVVASNDESAIGAMRAVKTFGLQIPQDVAIIGFDDSLEAPTQVPPLTTLHYSPAEMGYQALELLLEYISEPEKEDEVVTIPARLVVRQSCGCKLGAGVASVADSTSSSISYAGRSTAMSQVVQAMTESAMAEAQCLSLEEVHVLCSRLVEAFLSSLKSGEVDPYRQELDEVLLRAETVGEDVHIWHTAVSALENSLDLLLQTGRLSAMYKQAKKMLGQGRIAISESVRRQFRRYVVDRRWTSDRMGALNADLLTAMDEAQIFGMLTKYLPQMGIRHAGVAFFEAEGDDPVAWSLLHPVVPQKEAGLRFPSRQFPPPGLYQEPFRLALLPLAKLEERVGFAVFDTGNLEMCAAVVWQLIVFFRVARLYQEATEGRRLAEEASRVKSRFLSVVSHELRTPLSLIAGLSGIVIQRVAEGGEVDRQNLEAIHANAKHLDGLIRDVLDLARDEIGRLKLICEPLDLAEVLQPVAEVGEQLTREKGLDWQDQIPSDLPKVWGDRTRLRQVVMNLVNNAVKFTESGRVTLRAIASEEDVTVVISDTGLGIPFDEQERIFDEFCQCERTAARGYGGLGLGLAICKRLVELQGGQISVRSSGKEGDGSTFCFTVPRLDETVCGDKDSIGLSCGQQVLLGVDRHDEEGMLYKYLLQQGADVHVLEIDQVQDWAFQLSTSPPNLVVLDRKVASGHAWEILQFLRQSSAAKDVPVVFYSLGEGGDKGSVLELDYLPKPIDLNELTYALERQGLESRCERERTILVVDDEPHFLEIYTRMVRVWSPAIRVLKARNGREALDQIRRERPDLVLLDLMMPELDGFQVLEIMRGETASRDIPVIVLTGQALTQEDMARLNAGVASVLQKELFSVGEILSQMEAVLRRSKNVSGTTQSLARRAAAYIHTHYEEPVSLEAVAVHIGVCKEHLARCFREEMGVTLVTYRNRYRVERAKTLLREKEKRVVDVAMEVGFSSSAYFCRVFKQEVGKSPQAYRQTC